MIGPLRTAVIDGRIFLALEASHTWQQPNRDLHFAIALEKPKGVWKSNVAGKNLPGNFSNHFP
jgi:hypothetical protein